MSCSHFDVRNEVGNKHVATNTSPVYCYFASEVARFRFATCVFLSGISFSVFLLIHMKFINLCEAEVTNITIVFVLALMYCVVAPLMMPACISAGPEGLLYVVSEAGLTLLEPRSTRGLIYFGLAFTVYKWLFVHVYSKQFDLMGELWRPGCIPGMVNRTCDYGPFEPYYRDPCYSYLRTIPT